MFKELSSILHDRGVMIIFLLATLVYPFLYKLIYWNEQITDLPVAVVDMSASPASRDFLHKWDASPDVKLAYHCCSMSEAEDLLRRQKVHGIIYFPADFAGQIADPFGQAHISLYCDMSSFLYMKGIYLSCNQVMLEGMRNIQIDRYEQMGYDKEFAWALVQDAPYTETALFNPVGGYGSFLIPAVLMLILHQTLFFGICMRSGTAYELKKDTARIGKSVAAYFIIYYPLAIILTLALPRLFNLPHIGSVCDIMCFLIPYLLATICFSILIGMCMRNRESGMVLLISTSLIFLFLAGISWPKEMMPDAWISLSGIIPYTAGANGFIHINSMGATLYDTRQEYIRLWILAAVYFILAYGLTLIRNHIGSSRPPEKMGNP